MIMRHPTKQCLKRPVGTHGNGWEKRIPMIEIMGWNMNRSVGTRKARINETCHPPAHPMQNIQQTTHTTSG
jgi:hypothetical protein